MSVPGGLWRCSHLASLHSQRVFARRIHSPPAPKDGYDLDLCTIAQRSVLANSPDSMQLQPICPTGTALPASILVSRLQMWKHGQS